MRGPPAIQLRSSPRIPQLQNEAVGTPATIPAPVGGWNTINSLASMPATDAVSIENIYPSTDSVELRGGSIVWATGLTGQVNSILPFNGASSNKLFASTNAGVYDISSGGAVGAAAFACTNGKWQSVNFTNTGVSFLAIVNGVDDMHYYNGAWHVLNAGSVPIAITGHATADFANIALFKRRIWFVTNNSMSAWYLPLDAIGGALAEFPMGAIFRRGGYLTAQATWTLDGGNGPDDYLVTATSEGEIAVYKGVDPSDATTFGLVGVYDIGKPIGRNCFMRYGGDIIYLSEQGIFPLSKVLVSTTVDYTAAFNGKINQAYLDLVQQFKGNFGWKTILYQAKNALIINVPSAPGSTSIQLVMNNITKAWTMFTGWNANCMELYNSALYTGVGSNVHVRWLGLNDNGVPIVGRCQQAYTNFRSVGGKTITLVRPTITLNASANILLGIDSDFVLYNGDTSISYNVPGSTTWDSAVWDASLWDSGAIPYVSGWTTVPNLPGFFHSFRLQITTSTATFSWISTDYILERGGIF